MTTRSLELSRPVTLLLLMAFYGAMLYFRASIASLDDDYQPGIEVVRIWVSPGGLLFLLVATSLLVRSATLAGFAVHSCQGALAVCVLMLFFISFHAGNQGTWAFPQDRDLHGTIHTALVSPSFSNRSKVTVVGSALVALGLLMLAGRRKRYLADLAAGETDSTS